MIINVNLLLLKMSQLTRLSTSTYVKKIIHKFEYEDLKNDIIFNKLLQAGSYLGLACNFRFLQIPYLRLQAIIWTWNAQSRVLFAAGVQEKPERCRAFNVVKGP